MRLEVGHDRPARARTTCSITRTRGAEGHRAPRDVAEPGRHRRFARRHDAESEGAAHARARHARSRRASRTRRASASRSPTRPTGCAATRSPRTSIRVATKDTSKNAEHSPTRSPWATPRSWYHMPPSDTAERRPAINQVSAQAHHDRLRQAESRDRDRRRFGLRRVHRAEGGHDDAPHERGKPLQGAAPKPGTQTTPGQSHAEDTAQNAAENAAQASGAQPLFTRQP